MKRTLFAPARRALVEKMRLLVKSGLYKINAERIADKWLASEKRRFNAQRRPANTLIH